MIWKNIDTRYCIFGIDSLGEILWKNLTQIRSWAIDKFPIAHARCKGVRKSLGGPNVALTCSGPACASTRASCFISPLRTASANCCPRGVDLEIGARNSLASYFIRIQHSLSSRDEDGLGFAIDVEDEELAPILASQTLLASWLPIDNITAIWPGLGKKKNSIK